MNMSHEPDRTPEAYTATGRLRALLAGMGAPPRGPGDRT
jgi:hypothetical protein